MAKSIVANPAPHKVVARTGECMRLLLEGGLPFNDIQAVLDDSQFRSQLIDFWRRRGQTVTVEVRETKSQQTARIIMGKNMLGLPEVALHSGDLTEEQTAAFAEIPFSEEVLRECAKTHVLVADIGLSILDVRGKSRKGVFYRQDWFDDKDFAKETDKVCWRLIRKTPVRNSTSKSWSDQQKLISDRDEVPSARVVVYLVVLHFLSTGERLFEPLYVRTSSGTVAEREGKNQKI